MLRIIELEIDTELSGDTGVFEVAWVEQPAIEQDFVYFNKMNFFKVTQEISANACKAIKENEKRGNPAGTQVGKVRAQQLCKNEDLSLETVKRMFSYLSRAKTYNSGNWDDNGTISYNLWGGEPALAWSERIIKQEEDFQDDGLENACWEGYEPIGMKEKDGRMVPNCVKIENKKEEFVYPNADENEKEFIQRCMGDDKMRSEFPDMAQRAAVCYSYYEKKNEFSFEKVSFDWDGVLTTERGRNLFKNEINRGNEVFIVSSRNTAPKEMQEFIRKYTLNPTRVYTVGSDRNKIERIKSLGIERHYDDNFQIRRELGKVAAMFDYDVSALPAYESTSGSTMEVKPFLGSDCGCGDPMMMSQEQMDVFGYKTKNFDICPGAQDLFTHITSMPMDEDTKGMVRSAAQIADNVFEIEREVLIRGYSTEEELAMAKILVDDFKDLMKEIDALVGMNHDVSFMDGHIELITGALDDPQYWDEDEKELFAAVKTYKKHIEEFQTEVDESIQDIFDKGLTEGQIVGRTIYRNGSKFFQYAIKVPQNREPIRDWCEPREDRFFRRSMIDDLASTNTRYGHNGQPYSKWLYKGGPQCVHAWKQFTYRFDVNNDGERINERLVDNGYVNGTPGMACNEMAGKCYYPGTSRYTANLSKVVSQTYMDEKQFGKCFGEFCNLNFSKSSDQMFSANEEQRMIYSPLMIPNLLIPRIAEDGEKYFVKFTPEAIERIQRKFMIQQRLRETNLEHTDKKFNDVVMVESWIVNGNSDKSYTLGFTPEQVPTGSWMVGYKVLDTTEGDIIWNEYIKPGKVKGISAEGNFLLNFSKQAEDEYLLGEIIKILNKITK